MRSRVAGSGAAILLLLAGCATPPRPAPDHGDRHGPGGHRGPNGHGFRGPPPDRPGGRARAFISPMGEPFRNGPDPAAAWFAGVDRDHDGRLTLAEFQADAMRFYAQLDTNGDHEIDPEELDHYENVVAPEVMSGSGGPSGSLSGRRDGGRRGGGGRGGGGMGGGRRGSGGGGDPSADGAAPGGGTMPQGAARYGYLPYPEPVIAADADLNRGVSDAEFRQAAGRRFVMLDANHDGVVTADELPKLAGAGRHGPPGGFRHGGPTGPAPRDGAAGWPEDGASGPN